MQKQGRANDGASPLAVRYTCLPLMLGAKGETWTQLSRVLEMDFISDVEREVRSGIGPTRRHDADAARLLFGAVWLSQHSTMLPDNRWTSSLHRVMSVRDIDYSEDAFPARSLRQWADDWFREPSSLRIEVPEGKPDIYCVSVLDFNAYWTEGYGFGMGGKHAFRMTPTNARQVQMMRGVAEYSVSRGEGFTAVKIPCGDGRYAFWGLLPEVDLSPGELTCAMDASRFVSLCQVAKPERFELLMPSISIQIRCDYGRVLNDMGAPLAFDPVRADYSGMVSADTPGARPRLYAPKQEVDISVGEQGVRARFVTSFSCFFGEKKAVPQPRRIVFDHPFLFLVEDTRSGLIQFGGWVAEPAAAK